MTGLERRYRWLLRAYPRAYRQYRADEMLETLMGVGETDRRHPSLRESLALVVEGLRVRSGVDRLGSRGTLRNSALRLTALSLLVCGVTLTALPLIWRLWLLLPGNSAGFLYGGSLVTPALLLLALAAAAWAHYRLALAMTIGAFGAEIWHSAANDLWHSVEPWAGLDAVLGLRTGLYLAMQPSTWVCLLAALAMVPLLRARQPRVMRPWAWLVGTAMTIAVMTPNPLNGWAERFTLPVIVAAGLAAALVGAALDVRVSIAASAVLLALILPMLAYEPANWTLYGWEWAPRNLLLGAVIGIFAINVTVSRAAARRQVAL
ncbi:hypothetical protein Vqi01_51760 [Micromonospora qiuiae]|uniref:DUF2029 domain-containing protein n=1 Tax=Micromonospora qiuiae TaxID=502268 RepID=A0ABQ4JKJ8_9ACTN|nr:hypothetical protein [Micromonospora qiuiae]GIJ30014.1 hypothetical protein Vqi01_51760 [Micromonospora qiuiae]